MQFTNLNIFTFLIFIILSWIIAYFVYKKYFTQISFNKKYKLLASRKIFYIKYIFLLLSIIIILFWIFWVRYWEKKVKTKAKWIDTMFVLDVSKSMNVADIKDSNYAYTRLDIVKEAIAKYVSEHKQDRFWLVIFAWDAISTIPLTTDHDLFLTMLKWVDYRNLTVQGSNFSKAIKLWINRFTWDKDRSKSLVFISDWWDFWDNTNLNIKIPKNITYFVVWVGTNKGWRIIKARDDFGRFIYQRYKWQYVISRLNSDNLEKIANQLNWNYFKLKDAYDLKKLNNKLDKLQKTVLEKTVSWELWNFWRSLTMFSFIFFILFLIFYIFPNKLEKLWKKFE